MKSSRWRISDKYVLLRRIDKRILCFFGGAWKLRGFERGDESLGFVVRVGEC